MADQVQLTANAARQIGRTIRKVDGMPSSRAGDRGPTHQGEGRTFWGKMSSETDFTEVYATLVSGVLTWTTLPGGRTGSLKFGEPTGDVIQIRQEFDCTSTSDVPLYIAGNLYFGYLSADWQPCSNSVTLQPCTSSGTALTDGTGATVPTITAYIQIPTTATCPSFNAGPASGHPILAYKMERGITYLVNPPILPVPGSKYMVLQATTSTFNPSIWGWAADFVRAH